VQYIWVLSQADWFKKRNTLPWNDVVNCIVRFWGQSLDRQEGPCDVQSWVVSSSSEKWSSIAPGGYSVCHIRMFPEAHPQHTPWTDASQSKWYTQLSLNIYSRAHNTLSQNISESSALNIWQLIFCSVPISTRLNEPLKFNFRFAVLPESTTCKLNFESCVFHELTPGSPKTSWH
jgi:hypothetical protein